MSTINNDFKVKNGLTVVSAIDATSTTSGSVTIAGGAGIAKSLYVGGNLIVSGAITSTVPVISLGDDTTTDSNLFYPAMSYNQNSGTFSSAYVSSTKFYYNPLSGTLNVPVLTANRIVVEGIVTSDAAALTTTNTTATTLVSFLSANYGGGKFLIQASQGTNRQITELLVLHDGTTASATEYGTILTNGRIFNVEVSISAGSVLVTVTTTSATSTVYKASYTLIGA